MSASNFSLLRKRDIRNIFDIGLFFYFILNQLHYIFAFTGLIQIIVLLTINIIGFIMFVFITIKKKNIKVLVVTSILMLFGAISQVFIGNSSVFMYLTLLRYMGVMLYLLHYRQNPKITSVIMYTTLFLFIPVLFKNLGYNMFFKSSRNYYSILLLMVNFVYNKSFWDIKKKAPIFPTIASLFISLFAGGRGGIISYLAFFLGSLILNFKLIKENPKSKIIDDLSDTREIAIITEEDIRRGKRLINRMSYLSKYKKEILSVFVILFIFTSIYTFKLVNKKYKVFTFEIPTMIEILEDNITDHSYGFEGKALKSEGRKNLIIKYANYMISNPNFFINGVNLKIDFYFERFLFNLHNSYLGLHAKYGLGGLLLGAYLGFRALITLIKKKEWGHLLIYLAVLFRVALDTAAFPGHLDIVIFYYFFKFYYSDTNKLI